MMHHCFQRDQRRIHSHSSYKKFSHALCAEKFLQSCFERSNRGISSNTRALMCVTSLVRFAPKVPPAGREAAPLTPTPPGARGVSDRFSSNSESTSRTCQLCSDHRSRRVSYPSIRWPGGQVKLMFLFLGVGVRGSWTHHEENVPKWVHVTAFLTF